MKILVAEDDPMTTELLEAHLAHWGYEAVTCKDGAEAWQVLQGESSPRLALLDWMMPKMDGVSICRKVREDSRQDCYVYIILLTARSAQDDVVTGLKAGADDYVTKPFDRHELHRRIKTGERIIRLQAELIEANAHLENVNAELRQALAEVKRLRGLLPICASCKKIRDDRGNWQEIEMYIRDHSEADFSHGLCPECIRKLYPWRRG